MTVANIITLLRLVLLAVFVILVMQHQLPFALLVFALAWGLDVVDGYMARRLQQETRLGFILDKVVDRLLLITAGIVLINQGYLPPLALLLFTKDVAGVVALQIQLQARRPLRSMGWSGKIMTLLQGGALLYVAIQAPYVSGVILAVAVVGLLTSAVYLHRVVHKKEALGRRTFRALEN